MALGQYNLTRYNLGGEGSRYPVGFYAGAQLDATFGAGAMFRPSFRAYATLSATADMGFGYPAEFTATQTLTATANNRFDWVAWVKATQELTVEEIYNRAVHPHLRASATMDAGVEWNGVIHPHPKPSVTLTAKATAHVYAMPNWIADAALDARADGGSYVDIVMSFPNLTIPAGKALIIDTENCTAMLSDGTNVIQYYQGDWPWIDRNTKSIEVTSGTSGNKNVHVLYRERYL